MSLEMQEGHAQCAIYSAPAQAGAHIHSALFKAMQLLRTPCCCEASAAPADWLAGLGQQAVPVKPFNPVRPSNQQRPQNLELMAEQLRILRLPRSSILFSMLLF
jgi:hypothetical protein